MCGGRAADGNMGGCLASGDVRDRETLLKKRQHASTEISEEVKC